MINGEISDEILIGKILNGNSNLFKIIVKRYQSKIFSMGMRFFKNEDDANDFVQEAFIKIYQNLGSYREFSQFKYWMTKVAYNLGINYYRKLKDNGLELTEEIIPSKSLSPEKESIDAELKDLLLSEIEKLPENYKMALDFYFFMGLKYKEIAAITGLPVNTLKSNVLRAKKILRNSLEGTVAEGYND